MILIQIHINHVPVARSGGGASPRVVARRGVSRERCGARGVRVSACRYIYVTSQERGVDLRLQGAQPLGGHGLCRSLDIAQRGLRLREQPRLAAILLLIPVVPVGLVTVPLVAGARLVGRHANGQRGKARQGELRAKGQRFSALGFLLRGMHRVCRSGSVCQSL